MLISVIFFLIILSVLVLAHELGHFFMARRFGVKVEEFGFGFPPRLISKRFGQTIYSLNWLPFGGFVRIKGVGELTNPHEISNASQDNFINKSFIKKVIILVAGVLMNVLLAVAIFTVSFRAGILQDTTMMGAGAKIVYTKIYVTDVLENSPAHLTGIKRGDQLLKYDGRQVDDIDKFQRYLKINEGLEIQLELLRDNKIINLHVIPRNLTWQEETFVGVGISMQELAMVRYPLAYALRSAILTSGAILIRIFVSLGDLIVGVFSGEDIAAQVTGPVGIMVLTNQVAKFGISELLQFSAMLSLNFAIFNLIPFPALDGGRIFFVFLEKIIRRPVNQKIETIVHNIGFAVLLALVFLVTIKDIRQFSIFSILQKIIS